MATRVIQGFFVGGGAQPLPGIARESAIQRKPQAAARSTVGPPSPPHAGRGAAVQRFGGNGNFEVDAARLGLARGGGSPLPTPLLAKMEAAFGADFSAVRVHIGPQAGRIGAVAFTTGNDLYFAPGRYQPESVQGQQLIGHELAHVIQQRQGRVRAPGSGVAVVQDHALEAEADRLGMRAAMHRAAPLQAKLEKGAVRTGFAPGRPKSEAPTSRRGAIPVQRQRATGAAHRAPGHAHGHILQRALAHNQAQDPGMATYLTVFNATTGIQIAENIASVGGAHSEDRLIDIYLPAAAAAGQLDPVNDNILYIGINRSPCTSTDHCGNGQPSCGKPHGAAGCAERLIALVGAGIVHAGTNYTFQLVLEVRGLYGSNGAERANSAEAIVAMVGTGRITCGQQRTATSARFMDTGTAKQL